MEPPSPLTELTLLFQKLDSKIVNNEKLFIVIAPPFIEALLF